MLTGPPPKFHGTRDILRIAVRRRWVRHREKHGCGCSTLTPDYPSRRPRYRYSIPTARCCEPSIWVGRTQGCLRVRRRSAPHRSSAIRQGLAGDPEDRAPRLHRPARHQRGPARHDRPRRLGCVGFAWLAPLVSAKRNSSRPLFDISLLEFRFAVIERAALPSTSSAVCRLSRGTPSVSAALTLSSAVRPPRRRWQGRSSRAGSRSSTRTGLQ